MEKVTIYLTTEEKKNIRIIGATQDWNLNETLKALIAIALQERKDYEGTEGMFWEKYGF